MVTVEVTASALACCAIVTEYLYPVAVGMTGPLSMMPLTDACREDHTLAASYDVSQVASRPSWRDASRAIERPLYASDRHGGRLQSIGAGCPGSAAETASVRLA